jgi:hypothetical protein
VTARISYFNIEDFAMGGMEPATERIRAIGRLPFRCLRRGGAAVLPGVSRDRATPKKKGDEGSGNWRGKKFGLFAIIFESDTVESTYIYVRNIANRSVKLSKYLTVDRWK